MTYYVAYHFVSFLCAVVLVVCVNAETFTVAKHRAVSNMALWSYSIYLTHALVINATLLAAERIGLHTNALLPIATVLIMLTGAVCYKLIERPSMLLRGKWLPNTQRKPSSPRPSPV